jgi:methylenetetrahydrofolate dehydrogenase (NADP+)/methenyltetrahydrofolate cyclohydrolase
MSKLPPAVIKNQETIIFDGRALAAKKEAVLKKKVIDLKKKGVKPKLAIIVTGEDPASFLYVNLKKKAAERLGIEIEVFEAGWYLGARRIIRKIRALSVDPEFQGILVQMPLKPDIFWARNLIVAAITPKKDVDGLRDIYLPHNPKKGKYLHATTRAILEILKIAETELDRRRKRYLWQRKISVIGSAGMVGKSVYQELSRKHYKYFYVHGFPKPRRGIRRARSERCGVVISAVGVPGLITSKRIKEGAIIIDVGEPKGDCNFDEVRKKAAFITPVPGGVGPVTIACLLENLVKAAYNTL